MERHGDDAVVELDEMAQGRQGVVNKRLVHGTQSAQFLSNI